MSPSICLMLTLRTVKKIKLRDVRNDKIFREVSALSRLNHRFIVRYYTTWVETSDAPSLPILGSESEDSDMTEQTTTGPTSKPKASTDSSEEHFTTFDLRDLDVSVSMSRTNSTFPSIHFARTGSQQSADHTEGESSDEIPEEDEDEGEDEHASEDSDDPFALPVPAQGERHVLNGGGGAITRRTAPIAINTPKVRVPIRRPTTPSLPRRMLYIQMVRPRTDFNYLCKLMSSCRSSSSDRRCAR